MDREELRELLEAEGTEVCLLAADGLAHGALFDGFGRGHTISFASIFGRSTVRLEVSSARDSRKTLQADAMRTVPAWSVS
ncbi:hypothetical protein [Amycolatopsis benzoatilytica]|uniref:hypothetical protein n=1 Tax=Amycolatopsis benzoatilytica TaxID=346045 RepID=UPI00037DAC3C|nr:hypothetical protein [Amycolatopsis benzoatilytica]